MRQAHKHIKHSKALNSLIPDSEATSQDTAQEHTKNDPTSHSELKFMAANTRSTAVWKLRQQTWTRAAKCPTSKLSKTRDAFQPSYRGKHSLLTHCSSKLAKTLRMVSLKASSRSSSARVRSSSQASIFSVRYRWKPWETKVLQHRVSMQTVLKSIKKLQPGSSMDSTRTFIVHAQHEWDVCRPRLTEMKKMLL